MNLLRSDLSRFFRGIPKSSILFSSNLVSMGAFFDGESKVEKIIIIYIRIKTFNNLYQIGSNNNIITSNKLSYRLS